MTVWEYKIVDSKDIDASSRFKGPSREEAEAFLNEVGSQGWEILHVDWRELESRSSFTGLAKRARTG